MTLIGWILVAIGIVGTAGVALYTRRRSASSLQGSGPILSASLIFLAIVMVGFILEAIASRGVGHIISIVAAVLVAVLLGVSAGGLWLRFRTPQLTNIDIGRDGLLLTYTSGPITIRWDDIASLDLVAATAQLPAGISYIITKGTPSDKARPYQVRLMHTIARMPYDGLLAMPPDAGPVDQLLKRLNKYRKEPASRRELPVEGMGTLAAQQGVSTTDSGKAQQQMQRMARRADRYTTWPPQPRGGRSR